MTVNYEMESMRRLLSRPNLRYYPSIDLRAWRKPWKNYSVRLPSVPTTWTNQTGFNIQENTIPQLKLHLILIIYQNMNKKYSDVYDNWVWKWEQFKLTMLLERRKSNIHYN
jgi:hypothetical protein